MKLAFKKQATSFFGRIIKLWTLSKYCHVELVFSNGEWFSSREYKGAVSFCYGVPEGETEEMYDFLDLPMSDLDERYIRQWCVKEQFREDGTRCGYDVRGVIFSFLPIPIGWQSAQDWFCSEICVAALQRVGWFSGYSAASISPAKLYKLAVKEIGKK
jgi:hypothetical protein